MYRELRINLQNRNMSFPFPSLPTMTGKRELQIGGNHSNLTPKQIQLIYLKHTIWDLSLEEIFKKNSPVVLKVFNVLSKALHLELVLLYSQLWRNFIILSQRTFSAPLLKHNKQDWREGFVHISMSDWREGFVHINMSEYQPSGNLLYSI